MPTAEEILLRIRAEADESLRELDSAKEKVDELKEAATSDPGPLDIPTEDTVKGLEQASRSIDEAKESVRGLSEEQAESKKASEDQAAGLSELQSRAIAVGVALAVLRKESQSVREIGQAIATEYPEFGQKIQDFFEGLSDQIFGGPITRLKDIVSGLSDSLREAGSSTVELGDDFERLVQSGEDAVSRMERLNEEVTKAPENLQRTGAELGFLRARLEAAGEATDPVRIKLFQLADDLIEKYKEMGVEVPEALQSIVDDYEDLAAAAEASTERGIAAAERAAEAERRKAEQIESEAKRQADAIERESERQLRAIESLLEKEQQLLQRRLDRLEDFRESLASLPEELERLNEAIDNATGDPERIGESAEALAQVRDRLEELRSQAILTASEQQELQRLQEAELDLLFELERSERAVAQAGTEGTQEVARQKEALSEQIKRNRDRLQEFEDKFGELAPHAVREIEAIIAQMELQLQQTRVNGDEVESLGIRLEGAFDRGTSKAQELLEKQRESTAEMQKQTTEAASLGESLTESSDRLKEFAEVAKENGLEISEQLAEMAEKAGELATSQTQAAEATVQIADQAGPAAEGLVQIGDAATKAKAPVGDYATEAGRGADETRRIGEEAAGAVEQQSALEEQLRATKEEIRQQAQAILGELIPAERQHEESIRQSNQALRDHRGELEDIRDILRSELPAAYRQMQASAEAAAAGAVAALERILFTLERIEQKALDAGRAIERLGDL